MRKLLIGALLMTAVGVPSGSAADPPPVDPAKAWLCVASNPGLTECTTTAGGTGGAIYCGVVSVVVDGVTIHTNTDPDACHFATLPLPSTGEEFSGVGPGTVTFKAHEPGSFIFGGSRGD
jgi:hypothetical protein